MELKIGRITFFEIDGEKSIDVVVDIIGNDDHGLGQTWVNIPYDPSLTISLIESTAINGAKDKIKAMAQSI